MENTAQQFTMREMRHRVANPRVLAIAATAAAVCAIAGPYGTIEFPFLVRLYFWSVSILVACGASISIISYFDMGPPLHQWPRSVRAVAGALIFGIVNAAFLTWFAPAALGPSDQIPGYWLFFLYSAPVAVAITGITHLFRKHEDEPGRGDTADPSPDPPFIKRLKPELGHELHRLSMQDHYVEAFTAEGSQLVLMRFKDALDEIEGIKGWRIHRSHWVAESAIAQMNRSKGKTFVTLRDGAELPVSRTYLAVLKEAGVTRKYLR